MPFDLNGKFIEESEMFQEAITDPLLCLLLNPELSLEALNAVEKSHYVVDVEHEGKMYQAIVLGYYRVTADQLDDYNTCMEDIKEMDSILTKKEE